MSYGANQAVNDAEDNYREECALLIAKKAAALVAAQDMSREDAIEALTKWVRQENEAEDDVTGVLSIENEFPSPSKNVPSNQITAIAAVLLDAAREAADTI